VLVCRSCYIPNPSLCCYALHYAPMIMLSLLTLLRGDFAVVLDVDVLVGG
jgi:hypothetical protein